MKLTEEQAKQVWAILVDTCGAPDDALPDVRSGRPDDGMLAQFIYHSANTDRVEFRFQGKLGFGGKIHVEAPPRVDFYKEDTTLERTLMMGEANEKLCLLWDDWSSNEE